jgi:molybdopterin converting factor subunit 1
MLVTIRMFARLREVAGRSEIRQELAEGATVATAWDALAREYPALAEHRRSLSAAVNADYARFSTPLREGDEVAFLPPVSGGESSAPRRRWRPSRRSVSEGDSW